MTHHARLADWSELAAVTNDEAVRRHLCAWVPKFSRTEPLNGHR